MCFSFSGVHRNVKPANIKDTVYISPEQAGGKSVDKRADMGRSERCMR